MSKTSADKTYRLRPELPRLPRRLSRLPVDKRGYPVPWFAAIVNGEPEFRLFDSAKLIRAGQERRCWVCGEPLSAFAYFVISALDAVHRVSTEPPMHEDCAIFSAQACPFLTRTEMRRREAGLPDDAIELAGVMLEHNPGVILVWCTKEYRAVEIADGLVFRIGEPVSCRWFYEGRPASRDELFNSMDDLSETQAFTPEQRDSLLRLFQSSKA